MSGADPAQPYRREAAEPQKQLEQALLDLEHTRRASHTIISAGAMFGFHAVAALTHHVETAFDRVCTLDAADKIMPLDRLAAEIAPAAGR
jgi:chemotaxis protein histidine kinase CheA